MEEWRPVVGNETEYEVSSLGRVRRIGRARGAQVGHIMRLWASGRRRNQPKGYLHVGIHNKGRSIARLVLEAFVGVAPADQPQANHIDGDTHNNHLTNLEWVSQGENISHAYRLGLKPRPKQQGSLNNYSKLTEDDVRLIRRGGPAKQLSEQLGVSLDCIYRARRGDTWPHITDGY